MKLRFLSAEEKKLYIKEYKRRWQIENKEKNYKYVKKFRELHRELVNERINKYTKNRRINDEQFREKMLLRRALLRTIRTGFNYKGLKRYFGCSVEELRLHIEGLFQKGMSWNNWSYRGWHLDHKKPLAKFDLTKEKDKLEAFHFTNLQPLWAQDNIKKGMK